MCYMHIDSGYLLVVTRILIETESKTIFCKLYGIDGEGPAPSLYTKYCTTMLDYAVFRISISHLFPTYCRNIHGMIAGDFAATEPMKTLLCVPSSYMPSSSNGPVCLYILYRVFSHYIHLPHCKYRMCFHAIPNYVLGHGFF